jgi:hypothetical protein
VHRYGHFVGLLSFVARESILQSHSRLRDFVKNAWLCGGSAGFRLTDHTLLRGDNANAAAAANASNAAIRKVS